MPDPGAMRAQVYEDPRPAEAFAGYHRRARTKEPDLVYEVIRVLTALVCWTLYRARSIGRDNVPATGPVLIAANHFSNADHFFLACLLRRRVRFMAKSQLFRGVMGWVYSHGGAFPVRRGRRDEEAFETARAILAGGGCIAIYPEGGRSRSGALAERVRPGVGRLALESGASVVPVAIHGTSRVRHWRRLRFPRVTVRYGTPMRWEADRSPSRERQQAVADEIFAAVRRLYEQLDRPAPRAPGRWGAVRRALRR